MVVVLEHDGLELGVGDADRCHVIDRAATGDAEVGAEGFGDSGGVVPRRGWRKPSVAPLDLRNLSRNILIKKKKSS